MTANDVCNIIVCLFFCLLLYRFIANMILGDASLLSISVHVHVDADVDYNPEDDDV